MNYWLHVLAPASTEIFLLGMVCIIMLIDIFLANTQRWFTYLLTQLTLIVAGVMTWYQWGHGTIVAFDGQFILDNMAVVLKLVALLMAFAIFMYARVYTIDNKIMRGEFHILGLLSVVGGMVLISANSLLTLYLGLELLSLPLYAMVAMRRDQAQSAEAAMKYFVMGGVASGIFLFGMSLIYGLSKTILLPEIIMQLHGGGHHLALLFALALVIVAIAFKFGAVPFHMWVPDVYHGAPTSVSAFIGTIPKLAAFALFARLVWHGMAQEAQYWTQIVEVLAILSLLFGNVLAVVQKNLKRLLAYSTVGNVGFIFLGFVTNNVFGLHAAMFYTIAYVTMAVGAFGLLIILSHQGVDCDRFEDLAGLNMRNSGLAFMMTLILLSLAGIPPLVGFTAKLMIITNLINLHHYSLAIFALIMSVVAAYYYLRVVKVMYFDQPSADTRISNSADGAIALAVNGALVLLVGLFPAALLNIIYMTLS